MKSFLFAYGTLQPRKAPPKIRDGLKALRPVGHGTTRGELFDLGDYPGAIFSENRDTFVRGVVYRLPESREAQRKLVSRLDEYEGADDDPAKNLFVRRKVSVSLRSGRTVDCWAYEYNKPVSQSVAMFDGTYVGSRKKHRTSPKRLRSAHRVPL